MVTIAPLWGPFSLLPSADSAAWTRTVSTDTFVVCWEKLLLNGDPARPATVQCEIRRDGTFRFHYGPLAAGVAAACTVGIQNLGHGWTYSHGHTNRITEGMTVTLRPAGLNGWANSDPDGDGLSNYDEFMLGTDPLLADTDHDGMPDGWEVAHGLNPLDSSDASADPDHDGLTNLQEYLAGTDPHNPDTDGGGVWDGDEVLLFHTNPLDLSDDQPFSATPTDVNIGGFVQNALCDGTMLGTVQSSPCAVTLTFRAHQTCNVIVHSGDANGTAIQDFGSYYQGKSMTIDSGFWTGRAGGDYTVTWGGYQKHVHLDDLHYNVQHVGITPTNQTVATGSSNVTYNCSGGSCGFSGWTLAPDNNDPYAKGVSQNAMSYTINPGSNSGLYTITGHVADNPVCSAHDHSATLYVVNVKINGDYNRNGNPADDPHKDDPVTFAGPKGFVILANNNDSDGDGQPDCDSVSGQYTIRNNDLSDIYQVCIPKLGIPASAIPSGMTVSVQVLNPSNDTASFDAIIFPAIATSADGDAELDFTTPTTVGQTFGGTGTTILGIEGRTPGNEVRVRLTVKLNGTVLGTDEIRLLVAPFRVLDNTATASKVYVANAAPVQYWQQFYDDATNALNGVVAVEEYGSTFIQDSGEIGTMQSAPGQATRKQCTIMGLQGASYQAMISTNLGYFFIDCSDTKGGGGNIEAAPSVQNFPYGRLVVGSTLQSNAKVFLKAQKIQTDNGNLIELPTDWLQTGHVDEVMTFVPVGSGFKVLVADLQLAIDLLRTNQTIETEGGFATRAQILATYDANSNRVAAINSYLATVRANLAQGLGLNQNDFIRVPVPFTVVANQAQTALPNMMNMIVVKNAASTRRILMPEPYFDPFFNDIGVKLTNLGYQSSEIFTVDTRGPHGSGGEAHCASNVRREVP